MDIYILKKFHAFIFELWVSNQEKMNRTPPYIYDAIGTMPILPY